MGYAGCVPAKYAPASPTAVQAALYAVQSQDALKMIARLTKNVVVSPTGALTACLQSWDSLCTGLQPRNWQCIDREQCIALYGSAPKITLMSREKLATDYALACRGEVQACKAEHPSDQGSSDEYSWKSQGHGHWLANQRGRLREP